MVYDIISARVADVHDELKKLLSHLDDLPNSESVKQVGGSNASVTGQFSYELSQVANAASAATKTVIKELTNLDSTVRAALNDLTAHDDDLALGADQTEAALGDTPGGGNTSHSGLGNY